MAEEPAPQADGTGDEDDRVVARLLLPIPVTALEPLAAGLESAYGPGTRMLQNGPWVDILSPTPDERAKAEARQAQRVPWTPSCDTEIDGG